MRLLSRLLLVVSACFALSAGTEPTDLFMRGYAVIPTPQQVKLEAGDMRIDSTWSVEGEGGIARRSLIDSMAELHALTLGSGSGSRIALKVQAGTVSEAPAETADQAYRITLAPQRIEITGNAAAGLFYGVQTLVQLVKQGPGGALLVPRGEIRDWPKLKLRFLHWDTKHHQDRMETVKKYIDWSVRFKANMIGFELEDKFAYPSNPVIGAPGAFTQAQLQEIVNYGVERHLQVVPIVQAPAHMGYVLKYPQFAHLRADGNNYMSCLCVEDTYKLIFQMYDDLIAATKGIDYFYVSTDEVYYAGIEKQCTKPYNPANRSAIWADFAIRARDHLAAKGRRMLAWLEYPLLDKDLERIPADVIDGVVGDDTFVPIEKRKGMRQLSYVSTQGAEFLFPDHLGIESLPPGLKMGEFEEVFTSGRLKAAYDYIANGRTSKMNPIGVFGAAWDDSGLHSETFWLGWSAVASWGWHPGTPGPEQHAAEFMQVYYGPGMGAMVDTYRLLQRQARSWQRTWDRVVSRVRGPGYGNSDGPGIGTARQDTVLIPPALPDATTLKFEPAFTPKYRAWIGEAASLSLQNDQLVHSLSAAMLASQRNQYNLEVFLALARFVGHHWNLFSGLAAAERELATASAQAAKGKHAEAVGHLVAALNRVGAVRTEADTVHQNIVNVFEKSRVPNGQTVDGKKFFHVLDDTKDHWAGRTPDLGYMFASEDAINLQKWHSKLLEIAKSYSAAHRVPLQGLAEARLEE